MVVIYNVNDGIEDAIWPKATLFCQSDIDNRWVSQDERIFVNLSNYLAQYQPNTGYQEQKYPEIRAP